MKGQYTHLNLDAYVSVHIELGFGRNNYGVVYCNVQSVYIHRIINFYFLLRDLRKKTTIYGLLSRVYFSKKHKRVRKYYTLGLKKIVVLFDCITLKGIYFLFL